MSCPVLRLAVFGAGLLVALPAHAFQPPDCDGLLSWGEGVAGAPSVAFNAVVALPPAFDDAATTAAFGVPFSHWTHAEGRALDGALDACRRAAGRDRATADLFAGLRRAITQPVRLLRDADTARDNVAKAFAAIDQAEASPGLADGLNALATTSLDALGGFRSNSTQLRTIARMLPQLPTVEGDAVRAAAAERAAALAGGIVETHLAAIAAAPQSLDGILLVRREALAATLALRDGAAPVEAAASAREQAIAAALAALAPQPIRLPPCEEALVWAATIDPRNARQTSAGSILTTLEEPTFEALFRKPFPGWDAADLTALGGLAQHCRDVGRAGLLAGDPRDMQAALDRIVDLHRRAQDQPARFVALTATRDAALALRGEIEATPASLDGLAALQALEARLRTTALERDDQTALHGAIAERRALAVQVGLAERQAAIEALPATLDGMAAVIHEVNAATMFGPLARYLGQPERQSLVALARARLESMAPLALPEFEALVGDLPDDAEGEHQLQRIALDFIPPEGSAWDGWRRAVVAKRNTIIEARLPELEAILASLPASPEGFADALTVKLGSEVLAAEGYIAAATQAERAAVRATAIRQAIYDERCGPPVRAAGIAARDLERPTLMGRQVVPFARLVCGLADAGDGQVRHRGPGFFGSEHELETTVMGGYAAKLVLAEADVPTGGRALVGKRVEDLGGARDVSLAEWQAWSEMLSGSGGPERCDFAAQRLARTHLEGVPGELVECLIAHPDARLPASAS